MYLPNKKDQPFYTSLRMLSIFYVHPKTEKESFTIISLFGSKLLPTLMLLGTFLHMAKLLTDEAGDRINEDIIILTAVMVCFSCSSLWSVYSKQWASFFRNLTNFAVYGKPSHMETITKRHRILSKSVQVYIFLALITYVIFQATNSECDNLKKTKHILDTCNMVVPIWFPGIENISSTTKKIIFGFQTVAFITTLSTSCMTSFLLLESEQILVCRIEHLQKCFSEVFEDTQNLKRCVFYHFEILRMCEDFKKLTRNTFGHVLAVGALIIAVSLYEILKSGNIGLILLLLTFVSSLLIICLVGQDIGDATVSVSDAIFRSNWYKITPESRKILQFVVMRCQKPIRIQAIPWGCLDLALFLWVMKASYSYWTLILKSYNKNLNL